MPLSRAKICFHVVLGVARYFTDDSSFWPPRKNHLHLFTRSKTLHLRVIVKFLNPDRLQNSILYVALAENISVLVVVYVLLMCQQVYRNKCSMFSG